jgi:hypothetical protein
MKEMVSKSGKKVLVEAWSYTIDGKKYRVCNNGTRAEEMKGKLAATYGKYTGKRFYRCGVLLGIDEDIALVQDAMQRAERDAKDPCKCIPGYLEYVELNKRASKYRYEFNRNMEDESRSSFAPETRPPTKAEYGAIYTKYPIVLDYIKCGSMGEAGTEARNAMLAGKPYNMDDVKVKFAAEKVIPYWN